jgi:predicted RNA binding protein YcfA (HicA-like mRNA interferase family)
MQKLPRLSGKEVIRALSKIGFEAVRQKGSHVIMKNKTSEKEITTVVPNHKEVDRGTLLEIIRQARLTRESFMELL